MTPVPTRFYEYPLNEAMTLCEMAKAHFVKILQECPAKERIKVQSSLQLLNIEYKRLVTARHENDLRLAVIEIYGQDGWDKVRTLMLAKRAGNIAGG